MTKNKVIAYVDGLNVYGGLKKPAFRKFLWLDLSSLVELFLGGKEELHQVKYFTSPMRGNNPRVVRQSIFLDALSSDSRIKIYLGRFKEHQTECRNCGSIWLDRREKETDTGLTAELVKDAFTNEFDIAVLVAGDTDYIPAAKIIKNHCTDKKLYLLRPFNCGPCHDLIAEVDRNFKVRQKHLVQAQYPNEVTSSTGFTIKRPTAFS